MESPGLVILAVLGIGALLVLLPVGLTAFAQSRRSRVVVCPQTGRSATVGLDAGRAARGAIFGKDWLRIERCTLWPEREGCDQGCMAPAPAASAGAEQKA